jgi:hypothetical protein
MRIPRLGFARLPFLRSIPIVALAPILGAIGATVSRVKPIVPAVPTLPAVSDCVAGTEYTPFAASAIAPRKNRPLIGTGFAAATGWSGIRHAFRPV